MSVPYEILIRGKEDGTYSGAHAIDVPGGPVRPVKAEDWPELARNINAALVTACSECEGLKKAANESKAKADSSIAAIKAAVIDPDTPTEETVLRLIADATAPERDKKRAELLAQKAEMERQIAELG